MRCLHADSLGFIRFQIFVSEISASTQIQWRIMEFILWCSQYRNTTFKKQNQLQHVPVTEDYQQKTQPRLRTTLYWRNSPCENKTIRSNAVPFLGRRSAAFNTTNEFPLTSADCIGVEVEISESEIWKAGDYLHGEKPLEAKWKNRSSFSLPSCIRVGSVVTPSL